MSQCKFHGYDSLSCPGCRADAEAFKRRNLHGIFVWRGDGRYPESDALKIYKRESDAERYAEKLNQTNPVHVVRTVIKQEVPNAVES